MQDKDIDELQRIWDLRVKGAISEEEYLHLKARLFGEPKQAVEAVRSTGPQPNTTTATRPQFTAVEAPPRPSYPKIVGIGCLAIIALFVFVGLIGSTANQSTGNSVENQSAASSVAPAIPLRERQRQINAALAALKTTRTTDYKRKNELYLRLADLDPDNPKYLQMAIKYADKMDTTKRTQTTPAIDPEEYEPHPEEALTIKNFRGTKEGFGTVLMASFKVENAAPFPIKDFDVTCVHSAPSGTKIDENERTIYEVVPANGSIAIRNFNMGFIASQATQTSCRITSAVRA